MATFTLRLAEMQRCLVRARSSQAASQCLHNAPAALFAQASLFALALLFALLRNAAPVYFNDSKASNIVVIKLRCICAVFT